MARGLVIPFSLDPRQFARGLKVIETDLKDVQDAFRDVEKSGDKAADGIERSFRDLDVDRAFRDLGRDVNRELDDIARDARRKGRKIGDNLGDGIDQADTGSEIGREVGEEFTESWGEAVRSGDVTSAVTETLTNLGQIGGAVAGPAGAALGIALAGGAGLLGGFITKMQEQQQRIKDSIVTTFDAVREANLSGAAAADAFAQGFVSQQDKQEALVTSLGVDNLHDALVEIRDLSGETGLSVETITSALLGNKDALGQIETAWRQTNEKTGEQAGALEDVLSKGRSRKTQLEDEKALIDIANRALGTQEEEVDDVAAAFDRVVPPDLTNTGRSAAQIRRDAEGADRAIRNIPTRKTVTVGIRTRLEGSPTGIAILNGRTRF